MFSLDIQEKGLRPLIRNLKAIDERAREILVLATTDFMGDFVFAITEYPPESEANRPRLNPPYYYERRVGVIYNGGSIRFSSEQLEDKWKSRVRSSGNTVTGVAATDVSYAPYVQKQGRQAEFHAKRGWKTVEQILEQMIPNQGFSPGTRITISAFGQSRNYFIDAANQIALTLESNQE